MTTSKFRIGLWGTSRSGKTTFIAMVYHSFMSLHNQWDIQASPDSPNAMAFIKQSFETIFERKVFPEKTAHTAEYTFIVTYKSNPPRSFELTFIDAPGELYERYYDENSRGNRQFVQQSTTADRQSDITPQKLFETLTTCDGLLMFIDPAWKEEPTYNNKLSYPSLIRDILSDLKIEGQKSGKSMPLVALCMTKIDGDTQLYKTQLPDSKQCYRAEKFDDNLPVVQRPSCGGKCPIFDHIGLLPMRDHFPSLQPNDRTRCFLISSIGRTYPNNASNVSTRRVWQRPATPVPHIFRGSAVSSPTAIKTLAIDTFEPDSICDREQINPFRLLDPIIWMLNYTPPSPKG